MIHEVADSEDELDFVPPSKTNVVEMNVATTASNAMDDTDQLDPLHDTLFDDFLTPTQRLSSYDGGYDNPEDISTSNVLDSSTDRFLKALATSPASSSQDQIGADPSSQRTDQSMGGKRKRDTPVKGTVSKKRSRTLAEVDDGHTAEQQEGAKRRAKTTYGASSTAERESANTLDFQALMRTGTEKTPSDLANNRQQGRDPVDGPSGLVSIDARTDYTSPLDLSLHLSVSNDAQVATNSRPMEADNIAPTNYHATNSYTPRNNFFGSNLAGGMTSRSSMGNYQSFSIDPEKLGMSFDQINPFGSLSQVSLPGDLDSDETRGIAEIFRNGAAHGTKSIRASESEPSNQDSAGNEHATLPDIAKDDPSNRTSKEVEVEGDVAQCSPPFSQITNTDEHVVNEQHTRSRGPAQDIPVSVSLVEAKPAPKKRGRKPKKPTADEEGEQSHERGDASHLEDLPLNRSTRAGTVDSVSNASDISQGITRGKPKKSKSTKSEMRPPELQSKKLPSSDLGLDNKDVIGLSPERYVPRLSRRRGRGDSDTQATVPQPILESSQADELSLENEASSVGEVTAAPTPVKGKRGRKSKVKRAKTSAAALLKNNDELLDEEEKEEAKEIIFMDERPVKVKYDPLPEVSPDRALKTEPSLAENDVDKGGEITKGSIRRTKISVDIPVLPKSTDHEDLPAPVPEPKKRGRKRKKPIEEQAIEIVDEGEQRHALAEKDANLQLSKTALIDESVDDKESTANDKENAPQEKEETPMPQTNPPIATTPAKPVTTPASKQTHSPVKPMPSTPLFNARARIGLSKRHSIPSLLRKVDRNKEAPKAIEKKEKLSKWQLEEKEQERIAKEEAEAEGREYKPLNQLRGKDGLLVEWDF